MKNRKKIRLSKIRLITKEKKMIKSNVEQLRKKRNYCTD